MTPYLFSLAGQIVAMMLFTGIFRWVIGKLGVPEPYSTVTGAVGALTLATVAGGYGFADGGPPQFEQAFATYLPAAIIVLLFGLLTPQKKKG